MNSNPSQMKLVGLAVLAIGGLLALEITLRPEALNAPRWVAYLAASVFALAGGSLIARGFKRASIAEGCVALLLCAFLLIGLWIALGPGARSCSGGLPGLAITATGASCRLAFGSGAIVVAVMLGLAVRGWLRRRAAG